MMPAARIAQPHTRRAHGFSPRFRRLMRRSTRDWPSMSMTILRRDSSDMTLPFLGIAAPRRIGDRPHDDSAAEDDEQERPRRAVREAVNVQRHHLQPHPDADDPEPRPDGLAMKD